MRVRWEFFRRNWACPMSLRGNVRGFRPRAHSNSGTRRRTDYRHPPIDRLHHPEVRPRANTNLLDLRAPHFGLRANCIGLGTNFVVNLVPDCVPQKFGLISCLLAKQLTLSPRHLGRISLRDQIVNRKSFAAPQHSRERQSLLGTRRNPAQRGLGTLRNPMQRHKTSMLIFAVQPKRQHSESDPVSGLVRVHGGAPDRMYVGRTAGKRQLEKGVSWGCRKSSNSGFDVVPSFSKIIAPSCETLPAPSVRTISPG